MVRPKEHDRMKIAEEMIEWAKLPDSINLNKFCCLHDPILSASMIIRWSKEDPEFRQAYETAKSFLGYRREEKLTNNELHVKAYDLNATNYDLFLRDEKREQAQFESDLRKKEIETQTEAAKLILQKTTESNNQIVANVENNQ